MAFLARPSFLRPLPSGVLADLDDALERVRQFFMACLPGRLRRILARRDRRLLIEVSESAAQLVLVSGEDRESVGALELEGAIQLPDLAGPTPGRRPTRVLMMPAGSVLLRTVSLPAQVKANLAQVMRYELDRLSPFQAADVLYDFTPRPAPKGAPRLSIDLAICRRDLTEGWIRRLREAGAPVDRVAWPGAWPTANLLPPAERPVRRLELLRWDRLLWVAAAGLVVALLVGPLWQRNQILLALDEDLRQARAEAVAVDDLRQELEQARLGSTAVLQQKWDSPNLLLMLRDLTDLLPDDTWLQTL
ncbi:MAG: fimbrial assembly protein, partial [Sphingobacteriia bacterium]|nr:fimbrial assembly protein [Sphingobacteriia bacterium]